MAEIAVLLATKAGQKLVESLVDTVYRRISGELSLLRGVREEVQCIIDELQIISAFLREAEEKQASNEAVRAWVQQVRQLSYEVEDCIDEFSLHLERHRFKNLMARRRIAVQIKGIKSKVEEVSRRRLRYGIVDVNKASSSEDHSVVQYHPQLAALFIEDAQLVGIDAPREKLVGWLKYETGRELKLIAVVGGGGLGKTTIVKKAYEDPTVNLENFTCRAWITVSQVYHVEGLLRDMIKQFNPDPPKDLDKFRSQELVTNLKGYLNDKKYIIIFDDLWKIDAWKSLEMALPKNELGSRVMITIRNEGVAQACLSDIPGDIYKHEKLSPEQSMDLFCKRIFKSPACPEELKNVSEHLLKKCDGLPLAIVSIAGVLASRPKKTIQEWENLLGRLGSELEGNPNLEGVKRILTLSYDDLPYRVKRCFLYLSKYPEDYLMRRKEVQRLWMAEGFVAGRRDMTAEEVAESYFNELVNRSMILPATFSAVDDKVKSFKVHDIMLELILSKSFEEDFMTIIGQSSGSTPHTVIRHLSTHSSCKLENVNMSYVRSLFVFGINIVPLSSMRMLRVLDVHGCDVVDDDYFKNLGQLLHLKSLRIRFIWEKKGPGSENWRLPESENWRLPESLGNLRNLETLDIRGSGIIEIPSGVTKLKRLRVLRGGGLEVPRGIGRLRNLQELSGVWMEKHVKKTAREIGNLTQLRDLGFRWLGGEGSDELCKSLEKLSSSLRSLKVKGLSRQSCDSLDNLSSPPLLLESLLLEHHYSLLPEYHYDLLLEHHYDNMVKKKLPRKWVGQLNKVVRIKLRGFELDEGDIRVLGSLPNLVKLHLDGNSYSGGRLSFGAEEGFPRLKVLYLYLGWQDNVRGLRFEAGAMPHLQSITFDHIYAAMAVEGSIGIKNLPSLKEVTIGEQSSLLIAETKEHPNHPRLTVKTL